MAKRTKEQMRAEYQRRKARGAAKGLSAREAAGHKPLRVVELPGTKIVRSGSEDQILRQLRAAAKAGKRVEVRATVDTAKGIRTVRLNGSTPEQRDFLSARGLGPGPSGAGDGGDGGSYGGHDRIGKLDAFHGRTGYADRSGVVELTVGSRGVDARELLDAYLDYDGDWWDFIADWSEADYG